MFMNYQKIRPIVWAGFLATFVLIIVMYIENMTDTLRIEPVVFMSELAERSTVLWMACYFILGWIWTAAYVFFFNRFLSFEKRAWLRGAIYGILIAIIIRIGVSMTGAGLDLGNMNTQIIGLLLAYAAFGIVLGSIIGISEKK